MSLGTLDADGSSSRSPGPRRWRNGLAVDPGVLATLVLWLPMVVWFAALRPGLMSSDSIDVWGQATQGPWKDIHPPAYVFVNWVSSEAVGSPSLVVLGQSLFLAAAICAVARALLGFGCRTWAVVASAVVVAYAPMTGAF